MTPTDALALIDKIENCLQRMRIDGALRVAMIEDLDRLRKFVGHCVVFGEPVKLKPRTHQFSEDALDRLAENAQELGLGY